jgi:hypothetical protein
MAELAAPAAGLEARGAVLVAGAGQRATTRSGEGSGSQQPPLVALTPVAMKTSPAAAHSNGRRSPAD